MWPADRLRDPKRGLPALLQDVSRKGSKTIKEALELLDHIELLQWSVDELWEDLDDNRALHAKNLARFSNDKPGCDQVAAVFALIAVINFLRSSPSNSPATAWGDRRKRFKILDEFRQALLDLSEVSAPAPMLRPQRKGSGRRADVSSIPALKGILAGLMHCQQRAGMSRRQAAKWIVDNMAPSLAYGARSFTSSTQSQAFRPLIGSTIPKIVRCLSKWPGCGCKRQNQKRSVRRRRR